MMEGVVRINGGLKKRRGDKIRQKRRFFVAEGTVGVGHGAGARNSRKCPQ